jgi:hypothetical protein
VGLQSAGGRRYERWSPGTARLVLALVVGLVLYGALAALPDLAVGSSEGDPETRDLDMYEAVVDRVGDGEWYYDVAGDELRTRGYATRPFPNWRLPTTAWVVSALGPDTATTALRALAAGTVVAWVLALRSSGVRPAVAVGAGLLVASATAITAASSFTVLHEVWAGLLVALSLALRRWSWGASLALGLVAVAFRELALAYLVVMLVCAVTERRRTEAVGWGAGIAAFLAGLALHASVVTPLLTDADRTNGWVAGGGWPFVLATAQWNLLVLFLGAVVTAVIVPGALLGAGSWATPLGNRLAATIAVYAATFLVLGRPDNSYWGILYAPLLGVGLAFLPGAVRSLVRTAR